MTDSPATPRTQNQGDEGEARDVTPLLSQSVTSYAWLHSEDGTAPAVSPPMVDGALFDWEGMDLPLWDSFPFLAESTTM